ncbi:NGG1p interacting factor NIF3 [Treponema sp. J25]|uniref:NGG1p interacting factor NIF3 n=1 Tax=Treponema sp. J25 TaxID=2094121 RepID=UPI00104D73AA|nr:NGG1p interacting factor NIF3 [Treponema sp. J25]TCW60246.1 NGG1p interacting factor NIF3 [Treponema sp. J25]
MAAEQERKTEYGLYTLVSFVPPEYTEKLLEALFDAGAGKLGAYDHCAFVSAGVGRFRPLPGSDPFIGQEGKDELVREDRVELVVAGENLEAVLTALRRAHPYEEPAVYVYKIDPLAIRQRQNQ